MAEKKRYVLLFLLGIVCVVSISAVIVNYKGLRENIFSKGNSEAPGVNWVRDADSTSAIYPLVVEGKLDFAGEEVPLNDTEVKERLDREMQVNAYWQSNTILNMKYANRYFGEVEKTLAEQGVPSDFKYMILVESAFRDFSSPADAIGYWHILKETGKLYGLEMNGEVDERYNLEKSTIAACKYLKQAKAKLGSWTLAAASYNMGMEGVANRLKDQKVQTYYQLFLNQETSRYVFRMLAMKVIFSNPAKAGYHLKEEDLYQPYKYKVVEVDTPIANIADFAAQYGITYKHIKMLNPWLRDAQLTNKERKKYLIKILQ
jgi:membrane-bound lytic murein transglycosylase D